MSKDDAIRKTVGFGEDEKYLLDFALNQDIKFATYVKQLIKQDYVNKNNPKPINDEMREQVEEIVNKYLESRNLEFKEKATDKVSEFEFDENCRSALFSFMGKEEK